MRNNQASAIDSYQVIMEYFDEIKGGISDSNPKENTPNPQKHRIAIRALDHIGKNNLRGLYVGIKEEQEQKDKQGRKTAKQYKITYHNQTKEMQSRPKLISRLATTIIMKDGLWIG